MSGWIKLHRKMLKWEWWDDQTTFRLFMYLLLAANYEDRRYRGMELAPGSLVTGRKKLSKETGLTEKQVRRSLDKLEETHEVVIKRASQFSIINICNWEAYQQVEDVEGPAKGQQRASKGPADGPSEGQQRASEGPHIKKERNKEIKKKESVSEKSDPLARSLCVFLMESICKWMPTHKLSKRDHPPIPWLDDMFALLHQDKRTEKEIRYMIKFLFLSETKVGSFWAKNIQSAEALRDKFDRIAAEIREEVKARKSPKSPNTYSYLKMNELIMSGKYTSESFVILNGSDGQPDIRDPVTGKPMWRLKQLQNA